MSAEADVREVHVSAAIILDELGRALLVRKRGTTVFMQPGGKPEAGETPAQTIARELAEEIGVVVGPGDLRPLGRHRSAAANEPGFTVVADVFYVETDASHARAGAEIDELVWIGEEEASEISLAPLSRDLLPAAWAGRL